MSASAKITNVYCFTNGMTMTFDEYGQQMPEFQGWTDDVLPVIKASGYVGPIHANVQWKPRDDRYTKLIDKRGKP